MPTVDRMFRVIVAGGIALAGGAPALVVGCGGSVSTSASDAGPDGFPQETAGPLRDASSQDAGSDVDAFPQEGPPPPVDAGLDGHVADAGADVDAWFPQEGPNIEAGFFDTGHPETSSGGGDAAGLPDGFPQETASP
jgi:hypothetical protein